MNEENMGRWIMTRTGKKFNPYAPKMEDIDIEDIAHALSHICRFNGHTNMFYSVAEHSVLVSFLCPKELRLRGLLHDAAEAYLGDVPTPLKTREHEQAEVILQVHIFDKFEAALGGHEIVKQMDDRMLFWEAMKLGMNPFAWDWIPNGGPEDLQHLVQGIAPDKAKHLFLAHFWTLTHQG